MCPKKEELPSYGPKAMNRWGGAHPWLFKLPDHGAVEAADEALDRSENWCETVVWDNWIDHDQEWSMIGQSLVN